MTVMIKTESDVNIINATISYIFSKNYIFSLTVKHVFKGHPNESTCTPCDLFFFRTVPCTAQK